ncbi:MAG TPA: hypothetical protein VLU23_08790 [Pseudolabrys sp.]|nr:hypothetical protein [Pseudolabrys sp.]
MAKKQKAARKRGTRKPARRRRNNPDTTVNTLVVLVLIVLVLGGLFFYAQNKKQAALWPSLMQAAGTLIAPLTLPTAIQPTALAQPAPLGPIVAPETTASVPVPPPATAVVAAHPQDDD